MGENRRASECKQFLRRLREKGKAYPEFRVSLNTLEEEACKNGLDKETMKLALENLMNTELSAGNSIALIKCMIPRDRINDKDAKRLIAWFLSIPVSVTTLTMIIQWIIGCWEYQLINRKSIYIFYDAFFYTMLKQDKIESRLAHLIYLMTKPEDVTRRQVTRLLNLSIYSRKTSKHITALLSLFKSYKPEFVPENIAAINIQSTWRPIPESLRRGFEDARDRMILREAQKSNDLYCDWNIFNIPKSKKNQEPLVPSVKYFNIGSNIFSNKTEKSIFDVSNAAQLGQYHSIIKLPCNATSLLTNVIGYHLLTYADLEYQQRFMHNLYYTLWRSFIFENGRYSSDEMNQILDLTMEFSKYMQHGISIVNYFINEYLSCYMDEYEIKLLSLMQWSSLSVTELQDYVLKHMKLMFYSSLVSTKCKIIRTCRKLLLNLVVVNDTAFKDKSFPFLGQNFTDKLTEYIQVIENFCRELVTSALNIHNYNSLVVSEALSFYEQIDVLEVYRETSFVTLAPPAVIYGCFVTKSCALLSRVCALLLQYRKYFKENKDRISIRSFKWLIVYAEDLVNALWYDNCFSNRNASNRYFLKSLTESAVKGSPICDIDSLLNIYQHYAVLPYMYTLSTSGLEIKTKKDASSVAAHYYSHVNQFIAALLGIKDFVLKV
ncbi:hypothetical protein TSAR_005350 [Trichomalopsis sarcophagae]|uniref:Centromere protein I n=1 Tax=Trichomalopsis sarcophagae TaxID=543379 RepID=A0A232FAB2_9HYME|nr:hypothetical protein TSAR_005350 [Trichomalopsis sarcophagae]